MVEARNTFSITQKDHQPPFNPRSILSYLFCGSLSEPLISSKPSVKIVENMGVNILIIQKIKNEYPLNLAINAGIRPKPTKIQ